MWRQTARSIGTLTRSGCHARGDCCDHHCRCCGIVEALPSLWGRSVVSSLDQHPCTEENQDDAEDTGEGLDNFHVGDSRLYVFRHGVLKEMTSDHSFVTDAILSGKLTPDQAAVHPNRNMLTSALGSDTALRYSVGKLQSPQAGDTFLLASDGLWAYFKNSELCRILTRMTPKQSAQLLVELARERAGERGDNLSLIVIKLQSLDYPATVLK